MIQQDMLYKPSLNYIKKERFTGSCEGLRYLLEKAVVEENTQICVCVWPEPFAFDKTEDEKKTFQYFEFNQEGLDEAWNWIGAKQDEFAGNK